MMLVASVATNELTPVRTTIVPVTNPSTAPATTAARNPAGTPATWLTRTPTIADNASVALAVRSKTPDRMHTVAPAASRPVTAHWSSRLTRFELVRNVSVERVSPTTT